MLLEFRDRITPSESQNSHNFQFNSSTEGSLSKCLFETAHNASNFTDVDALRFRLVQHDTWYIWYYNGQI